VGALGVPFQLIRQIRGAAYPFLNTGLRRTNEYAFHALGLDEHRKDFIAALWTNKNALDAPPRPIERTEQRWFVGAHGNVGGGCFNDSLAQLPFKWIQGKASALRLTFTRQFPIETDAAACEISDSFKKFLKGWYPPLRFWQRYHREIGVAPKDEGPSVNNINETIDVSVFNRWRLEEAYRPPSLKTWATKWQIDPASILKSVRADSPSISAPD
jgi:Uncharacterized alpha/beta hydrolase domain (DUF2235)